jgi:homoserine kinase type II
MAVFTALSREDIEGLLAHYVLGPLQAFEGIASGIENTNYFVDTASGRWVLTVFERLNFQQLPYYLELMRHLARRGLPVPLPQENRSGALVSEVRGKPAAFVTRVAGRWMEAPDAPHCAQIGALLARMHVEARDFEPFQPNLRGIGWWKTTLPKLEPHLDDSTFQLLAEEVILQDSFFRDPAFEKLPQGAVHADLFRDNVLWDRTPAGDERIGGVIDFYFAGNTLWLFDLAVTVNDWCVDPADGALDHERAQALLDAYHEVRPLTELEGRAWRTVLRGAALRFWMSRLYDLHVPRDAHTLQPHDPTRFELTLKHRIADERLPWVAS